MSDGLGTVCACACVCVFWGGVVVRFHHRNAIFYFCSVEETSVHILCECETLASLRHTYLGSLFLDPGDIRLLGVGAIWNFAKGTGLL